MPLEGLKISTTLKCPIEKVWSAMWCKVVSRYPPGMLRQCVFSPITGLAQLDGSTCDTLGLNNYPLANFRWDYEDTLAPLQVTFSDLSAYAAATWEWTFGDGHFSQDTSPVHVYDEPGIYYVCQNVSNVNGKDANVTMFRSVFP